MRYISGNSVGGAFGGFSTKAKDLVLPDMRHCSNLIEVYLEEGTFSFPGKIPFPRELKSLCGSWYARVNWDKDELEIYFENCSISSDLEHWRE